MSCSSGYKQQKEIYTMKTRINNYIRQLQQLYEGGSWQGESYLAKLKAVDKQIAFAQPVSGNHCVAEILWHVIFWRTIILRRIGGEIEFSEKTKEEQNFLSPESLKKKGWNNLVQEFNQSQKKLIELLESKNDDFLNNKYQDVNFDYLIEGIIHHDVYHLGQIGLVISILKNKSKK
jgi:uncharacterized damage-inducible protein DinB